jgi:hypothetical protein
MGDDQPNWSSHDTYVLEGDYDVPATLDERMSNGGALPRWLTRLGGSGGRIAREDGRPRLRPHWPGSMSRRSATKISSFSACITRRLRRKVERCSLSIGRCKRSPSNLKPCSQNILDLAGFLQRRATFVTVAACTFRRQEKLCAPHRGSGRANRKYAFGAGLDSSGATLTRSAGKPFGLSLLKTASVALSRRHSAISRHEVDRKQASGDGAGCLPVLG